jgi:hypothetical protein
VNNAWADVKARVDRIEWPKVSAHGDPQKNDVPPPVQAPPAVVAPQAPVAMAEPEPAVAEAPQPAPVAAPQPAVAAPQPVVAVAEAPNPAAALDQARKLWGEAIDAEARQDFAGAARLYEAIKRLPSDAWPGGLDFRLKFVQGRASQQSSVE